MIINTYKYCFAIHKNWSAPLENNSIHRVAWLLLSSSHTYNLCRVFLDIEYPFFDPVDSLGGKKETFPDSGDHIKNFLTSSSNEDIGTQPFVNFLPMLPKLLQILPHRLIRKPGELLWHHYFCDWDFFKVFPNPSKIFLILGNPKSEWKKKQAHVKR